MVEVAWLEPGLLQNEFDGPGGIVCVMLDAPEALLLGGGHEAAVHEKGCRCIVLVAVETQDCGHDNPLSFSVRVRPSAPEGSHGPCEVG